MSVILALPVLVALHTAISLIGLVAGAFVLRGISLSRRPGGRIGLANWTPDSFIGQLFKTIGKHVPPPAGVKSPALWGSKPHLDGLFGSQATIAATERQFTFRYRSPAHWLEVFGTYYGPVFKALGALEGERREALENDLRTLLDGFNEATDGTLVVPSGYLEVVVVRPA